jgi:hypothetical protein
MIEVTMDQQSLQANPNPIVKSTNNAMHSGWPAVLVWHTLITFIVATTVGVAYPIVTGNYPKDESFFFITRDLPVFYYVFYGGLALTWFFVFLAQKFSPRFIDRLVLRGHRLPSVETPSDFLKGRAHLTKAESAEADRFVVTEELSRRVEALRSRTRAILVVMGFALAAAAIIVLFAGRLTSLDATAVSNIDRLKSDITDSRRRLTKLYQFQSLYNQYDSALKALAGKEMLDGIDRQISRIRDDQSPQDSRTAAAMIELEQTDLNKLGALLNNAWEKELGTEKGNGDWKYIVATAITRVGVVLVIVYLVQILMNFYRYNTRLITHYNSRRDLLVLWDGKQRDLKNLEQALAPSKIDFGKEPKHPLEDITKAAAAKLVSAVSRRKKDVGTS